MQPEYLSALTLTELFDQYVQLPDVAQTAQQIREDDTSRNFHFAQTFGSQRQLLMAALLSSAKRSGIVLLNEREAAIYAANELDTLLPDRRVLVYPASGKRPGDYEQIDNANVLQRAEVLNAINSSQPGQTVIVTYPEALLEKVVNRKALVQNTLRVEQGVDLGQDFVAEILTEYGFDEVSFVVEPGQYAIRGGLIDVFSYSSDYPFRIEFLGDEIDSIRSFDPVSQLSKTHFKEIALIPDIHGGLISEERVSFFEFISPSTIWFTEDLNFAQADLEKFSEKRMGDHTADLMIDVTHFRSAITAFPLIEIGQQPRLTPDQQFVFKAVPQRQFHKEFKMLAEHFLQNQEAGYQNYIISENPKQIQRLQEILAGHEPDVKVDGIEGNMHRGFIDRKLKLVVYTDHEIFQRYHRYKAREVSKRGQALTLKELTDLNPGDYVTHVNHGIAKFGGLEMIEAGDHRQEAVKLFFRDNDVVYVNINALHKISKFTGKEGTQPRLSKLGSAEWERKKQKVKKRVKELAFDLIELYAKRKAKPGFAYSADGQLQRELEASFLYEDTPDQATAVEAVKEDMQAPHPMDRLICGDVGFGKTEVAIRAAFKAVANGKQVGILVPTTILAMQHANTFRERFEGMPVVVEVVNRFVPKAKQKEIIKEVSEGKVDILIGTHRLLSKDFQFKDLGLLVIDEEHKFGVAAKEKIRHKKVDIDTLTLTATPIPRTLQFSLLGIRDMSVIATPPPNRQPVDTQLISFDTATIRDAIAYELQRGGQVFYIHNRVKDLDEIAAMIKKLVPDARVRTAHGQMAGEKVEKTMVDFMAQRFDVLISTTIIEAGLDISNANTMIINNAHMYGLSDLHQMRGRVGRSNRKAFCYLISPPINGLPEDSRRRLEAIVEFADVGSGIQIAMRDLDIRGAGDILGGEQSGFISDIGYELYNKILDESIRELKEEHFSDTFEDLSGEEGASLNADTQIDTDKEAQIPQHYLPDIAERLNFYRRISNCHAESELQTIGRELIDRFGLLPKAVLTLFDTIRIREIGSKFGFSRIVIKGEKMRCYFNQAEAENFVESNTFQDLMRYVQQHPNETQLKQKKEKLIVEMTGLGTTKACLSRLRHIEQYVFSGELEAVEAGE